MNAFRILVAMTAMASACASADVLYKLVDKNGKVTYSEEKPKNFDGQVIRLDIDPKANTATLPKAEAGRLDESVRKRAAPESAASRAEARIAEARERLERAQRAFTDARDHPAEGDMEILGNKGGGVRMIPTPDYQKKLDALEQEVKEAEAELRRAERES